jgi:CIC family chloride channel protein
MLRRRLGIDKDWRLVGLAAIIGVLMSGVAIAFILPLRELEHAAEYVTQEHSALGAWLVPIMPIVGGLLAGTVAFLIGSGAIGHGVSAVMYAIYRNKSRLSPRLGLKEWLASTLTIGSGGSAGAEGPIVTIGAVFGSLAGQHLKLSPKDTATLLGCAAGAGIASVFSAPFAGIFFVLEILLRDFSMRTFTPIVIACVIAAGVTNAILGHESGNQLFQLGSEFGENAFTLGEFPNYLILGLICGASAAMFLRALLLAESQFQRMRVHPIVRPAIGAAMLGALGFGYLWIIQDGTVPAFYGNGYPVITSLTSLDYYYHDEAHTVLKPTTALLVTLIALGTFKALATSLTIGSGGAGGMFAPAMLIGAAVGGTLGTIVNALGWGPSATPAHYAVVGMAAFLAASTHAPFTGILIVYELTQSYEIMLPLMFTAVISTIVSRLMSRESMYTASLARLGVKLGTMIDLTLLRRLSVSDVVLEPAFTVQTGESAQRLMELTEEHVATDFVVIDEGGAYVGLVTGADLTAALIYREAIPLLQVSELTRTDLPTVSPDETLDAVLDKFSAHDVQCLVVLTETGEPDGEFAPRRRSRSQAGATKKPRREQIVGLITRQRLMHRYQDALQVE